MFLDIINKIHTNQEYRIGQRGHFRIMIKPANFGKSKNLRWKLSAEIPNRLAVADILNSAQPKEKNEKNI